MIKGLRVEVLDFRRSLIVAGAFGFAPSSAAWYTQPITADIPVPELVRWWDWDKAVGRFERSEGLEASTALAEAEEWLAMGPLGVPDSVDLLYAYKYDDLRAFLRRPDTGVLLGDLKRLFGCGEVEWTQKEGLLEVWHGVAVSGKVDCG